MTTLRASAAVLAAFTITSNAAAGEWDLGWSAGYEARAFLDEPAYPGQFEGVQSSLVLEGEVEWESENRAHEIVITPFARLDGQDAERTHADLREAYYRWSGDSWSVRAGVGKVFWGVTESRHLVDIVNQTDAVEDTDEEDKLGQLMVEVERQTDWGRVSVFVLPGFRERTFPGPGGRLRPPLPIDEEAAIYESSAENERIDVAGRYSHFIGSWDIGLSVFHGTSREPLFQIADDFSSFVPVYNVITQGGLDLQYTSDAWLWKLEALVREGHGDTFGAMTGGFEYTFYGIAAGGAADLGVLLEYHYDGRDEDPSIAPLTTFDNDVFAGARFALNDAHDSSVLAGAIIDAENASTAALVEAERRIGSNWFVELTGRFTVNVDDADPLAAFDADDSVTLRATRYF